MGWLAQSAIHNGPWIVDLCAHKDPSGLYLADPENFTDRFSEALEGAEPWRALASADRERRAAGGRRAMRSPGPSSAHPTPPATSLTPSQVTAAARPDPTTFTAAEGETVTIPAIVSATAVPRSSGPEEVETPRG